MRIARTAAVLLALATWAAAAAPASAQVSDAAGRPGWIGVSFEVLTTGDVNGSRTEATITEVSDGSPAARAGLRVGDRLLSVNGMPATVALATLSQTLRPGDPVRVAIERVGRRMEMLIRAVPRPANVVADPPTLLTWTTTSDSVVDRMFQAMDSLRVRLAVGPDRSVQVVGAPGIRDSIVAVLRGRATPGIRVGAETGGVRVGDSAAAVPIQGRIFLRQVPDAGAVLFPEIHPPFDFYVFSGSAPDSLLREMADVDRKLRATRALEQARLRTLANQDDQALVLRDEELLRLRQTMKRYEERSNDLHGAVRRAAARSTLDMLGAMDSADAAQSTEAGRFRPLTPYRLGQNWVAGAQMVDLKPELGTYFQVQGGVLVVEVPGGTPAALAGLQPGDVIVRAGTVEVRSIEDLRTGLSEPGDTLHLQLVRRGRTIRAVLGR